MKQVILASASPRRQSLLHMVVPDFSVYAADIDEQLPAGLGADKAAEYLAKQKAAAVSADYPDSIVIGCDTVVVIDDRILGKPADQEDCRKMLRLLSGRTHQVYTGVALQRGEHSRSFTVCTDVRFYTLSDMEIDRYIATGEPFDKAGGYGIQGLGALLIEGICGDYYNVVGLPVSRLLRELADFSEWSGGLG